MSGESEGEIGMALNEAAKNQRDERASFLQEVSRALTFAKDSEILEVGLMLGIDRPARDFVAAKIVLRAAMAAHDRYIIEREKRGDK